MKKVLSILLSALMIMSLCTVVFAGVTFDGKVATVKYNEDGTFKILQVNDFQDRAPIKKKTINFVKKAIELEKPDLAIIPGDNLSEWMGILGSSKKEVTKTIRAICQVFEDAKIPFIATFGNHDHDSDKYLDSAGQMEVYKEFSMCVWYEGNDPGTFNVPIYSHDGSRIVSNIYIIDSNNKGDVTSVSGYTGLRPDQVEWYKNTSDALKAQNGGEVVPSLLFQHVPVKEIYGVLEEVGKSEADRAAYSMDMKKWYAMKPGYLISPENETLYGEAPCSESLDTNTGEYQAWLEKGDIIGAFFGHDHLNNFVVKDDNGIVMAYTGGAGFNAYGDGARRVVRIIELNENDPSTFSTHCLYYNQIVGKTLPPISDIASTALLGNLLRFLYKLVGIIKWWK